MSDYDRDFVDNTTPRRSRERDETVQLQPGVYDDPTPTRRDGTLRLTTDRTGVKVHDMVTLFEIDGVAYQIEKRARPNLSYGYLRRVRTEGAVEAAAWLMEKMLTPEALKALEEYEDLTEEEDAQLQAALERIALGGAKKA